MSTITEMQPGHYIDQASGASVYRRNRMAELLKISERQLDRLALAGKLPVRDDGLFPVRETIDRYAEYVADKASRSSPQDTTRRLQAEAIRGRMKREEPNLILMTDAVETIDTIAAALLAGFDEAAAQSIAFVKDPARAKLACASARENLVDQFAEQRAVLIKGPRKKSDRS